MVKELFLSLRTGAYTVLSTVGAGLGSALELLPQDDILKLSALVGLVLGVALLRVHLLGAKKIKLEIEAMEAAKAKRYDLN